MNITPNGFSRPPSCDDPWIETKIGKPKQGDGAVWAYWPGSKSSESRIYLIPYPQSMSITMAADGNGYSHWKPARLVMPFGPHDVLVPLVPDEALTAWRELNPDYAPDDVPPDSFVYAFELGKAKEGAERSAAIKRILEMNVDL